MGLEQRLLAAEGVNQRLSVLKPAGAEREDASRRPSRCAGFRAKRKTERTVRSGLTRNLMISKCHRRLRDTRNDIMGIALASADREKRRIGHFQSFSDRRPRAPVPGLSTTGIVQQNRTTHPCSGVHTENRLPTAAGSGFQ
jgi:hypothetical protein